MSQENRGEEDGWLLSILDVGGGERSVSHWKPVQPIINPWNRGGVPGAYFQWVGSPGGQ